MQDQIADVIRERIIVGEYNRGQRLKQMELASEFGVSVTPVREAFHILEAEGYVKGDSHKGAIVPSIDIKQAREIRDLRLLLERELIQHALDNMDGETLAEARRVHKECEEAVNQEDRLHVRRLNYHFHFLFYELAGRPQTLEFVRVLWAKYPFHDLDAIDARAHRMQAEHSQFLDHVAKGDYGGAVAAMHQHISKGWTEFAAGE